MIFSLVCLANSYFFLKIQLKPASFRKPSLSIPGLDEVMPFFCTKRHIRLASTGRMALQHNHLYISPLVLITSHTPTPSHLRTHTHISLIQFYIYIYGLFDSSVDKESTCNAGDPGLTPGSERSTGEGIGYPLQYSWASLVTQLVKNLPAMRETWV